jgi:hypothetical protein
MWDDPKGYKVDESKFTKNLEVYGESVEELLARTKSIKDYLRIKVRSFENESSDATAMSQRLEEISDEATLEQRERILKACKAYNEQAEVLRREIEDYLNVIAQQAA